MKFYYSLFWLLLLALPTIATAQNDCPEAITVCGNADFTDLDATGVGEISEITIGNACFSGENNTVWLELLIKDGGTLGFVLTPASADLSTDFDFWLFGPDVTCNALGTAIRCSTTNPLQAGLNYVTTGMNDQNFDVAEGPGPDGDAFINWITVQDGETYYLIVDRPVGNGNFSIDWIGTATFHDIPEFLNPDNIPLDLVDISDCDGNNAYGDPFDLTIYEDMFVGSQTYVELTYHTSTNDVTLGENPIADPENFDNTENPQTIYIRMTNTVTGCYDTESFSIEREIFPAGDPISLTECDYENDGHSIFNLAVNDAAVINGQPNCVVHYYNDLANAVAGTNPVGPVYENQVPYQETIYARLMHNGCQGYDLKSFTISTVIPQFENPGDININLSDCDDDGIDDNATAFDLTVYQDMFIGTQDNITFTYHLNENDADLGNNAIALPDSFVNTTNPQTIYMRIYDADLDCRNFMPFTITITDDVVAESPGTLLLCDENSDGQEEVNLTDYNSIIQNGNTNGAVTYYTSQADAQNQQNAISTNYIAYYTPQVLWARLDATQGCFGDDITSFIIRAVPMPVLNNPQNVDLNQKKCDDDTVNDNATDFDLTLHEALFTGSQTGVDFSYHSTFEDAETGFSPLASPQAYISIVPIKTIYVRMVNQYGCHVITQFTIEIEEPLQPGNPVNLYLCDTSQTGFNVFNLAQNTPLILGSSIDGAVSYHTSQSNALNGINPITTIYQNQNIYSQTIWARLYHTGGCQGFYVKHFTITVHPLPQFTNPNAIDTNLTDCDDDAIDDQSTLFNLTTHQVMFKGTQVNTIFTYYTDPLNADLGISPIQSPQAFANTSNPQTLYIRAFNTVTGCHNSMPFTIEVTNPVVAAPLPQVVGCDADGNGFEVMDLTLYNWVIQGTNTTAAVTYYNTEADAQNEAGAITTFPATYTVQTLWARLENTQGCFGHDIISFTIWAMPLPVFNNPQAIDTNLLECDDDGVHNNATAFNLTQHQAMFIGTQTGMQVTYYTTAQDAQDGTNAIGSPQAYINTSVVQTIYVRMANAGGCFTVNTFTIEIQNPLYPGTPLDLAVCDDNKNGRNFFDLSLNDALIINGSPNGVVSYHTTLANAQNNINPLALPYQNQWAYGLQIIYARLQSSTCPGGYRIVAFKIHVERLPQFNNPQPIDLALRDCDDDAIDDHSTLFDLTTHNTMFTGGQTGLDFTYYTDAAEAAQGINAIAVPGAFANTTNPQTVYIRIHSSITGCYDVLPLEIEVINPLHAGQPDNLGNCDTNGKGLYEFDLASNTPEIQDGQANTQVTYYLTQQDAENETNPINELYTNQQPYGIETIWARIENISGCFGHDITSFTIQVFDVPNFTHTIDIVDFTYQDNAITIHMGNNPDSFEFSINGQDWRTGNTFSNLPAGIYTVYIRSANGCKIITEEVALLNYPKFFTPNGDGANEYWNVYYLSFYPNARVNIFDRYGKLVKSYWGKDTGWDGSYNGHNLLATDYWFVLEMEGGRKVKGHFSLLR